MHFSSSQQAANENGAGPEAQALLSEEQILFFEHAITVFSCEPRSTATLEQIAQASGRDVSQLKADYGSAEALYLETVHYICTQIDIRGGERVANYGQVDFASLDLADAHDLFISILDLYIDLMILDPMSQNWAKILILEHLEPGPAFEIMHERMMVPQMSVISALFARLTGRPALSDEAKLRIFVMFGQLQVFKTARHAILRIMDWDDITEENGERIRRVIHEYADGIIDIERKLMD